MKKILIIAAAIVLAYHGNGQGFFNQKGAWIKNQLKQIALFEVYIMDLKKGYDIAKKGLNTISDIKNGDLHLHLDNFTGLKAVNPKIKSNARVADIIALQLQIMQISRNTIKQLKLNDLFNDGEINYITSVFTKLLEQCGNNIDELIALTTSGEYKMKDDERLQRIDALATDMQDKYSFANSFSNDTQVLSLQGRKEKNEVQTSRLLNNIKNP